MKTIYTLFLIFITIQLSGQVPQAIPYQAVARDASGNILASQAVSVKFSIRNSTAGGVVLYSEIHNTTTNASGLFSLNIGQGTVFSGSFSAINWAVSAKYLQVEYDPTGGSSYINMGTQQMMSVPYAQYAAVAGINTIPIQTFAGYAGAAITGSSSVYVYAGPTTTIILTSSKKITGVATAMLGLPSGGPNIFDYGLCYSIGAGALTNFAGGSYTTAYATSTRLAYTASYSITLSPGTYNIGLGVKNTGPLVLSNNDYVNGWIMITEP